MAGFIAKFFGLAAYTGLVAVTLPHLRTLDLTSPALVNDVLRFAHYKPQTRPPADETHHQPAREQQQFACIPQNYTTQIVSLDPLVIYIRNFLSPSDIPALLEAGEPAFAPSHVYKDGRTQGTSDRTSSSAGLPPDAPVVRCVLSRAEGFLGTMLAPGRDEIGPPQLVRYAAGQRFNAHHDWYDEFQPDAAGLGGGGGRRRRRWNRVASFFAVLEDSCTGGETYFPEVEPVAPQDGAGAGAGAAEGGREREGRPWRRHEKGGLAFRPVRGNALFWVNLHANGTGDRRTVHAGLPLGSGSKTAMNIWPKRYVGPEAWGVADGAEGVVDDAEVDPI